MAYSKVVTKEEFITEIKKHQQLDSFRQGFYFEESKGCAVGCSIESIRVLKNLKHLNHNNHNLYEEYLGIPNWLACLEDKIFEMLFRYKSKEWPLEFSEAINTGSNLDQIKIPFLVYLLEQSINNLEQQSKTEVIKKIIEVSKQTITALKSGNKQLIDEVRPAVVSTYYAASAATYYTIANAFAAASAAASVAACSSAASVAAYAVYTIANASAYSAAYTIAYAYAASVSAYTTADVSAYSSAYITDNAYAAYIAAAAVEKYKNKLLELIRDCK